MVTRTHQQVAGAVGCVTAGTLTAGLVLLGGGPPTSDGGAVRTFFAQHGLQVRLAALVLLAASVALVIFAVAVREAIWATIIDRNWAAMLFVQAAVGFAAVSAVAAALLWSLADQTAAGTITADVAGILWAVDRTLWRFATWSLTVPLLVVSLVLHRYSTVGQFGAVTSVMVAGGCSSRPPGRRRRTRSRGGWSSPASCSSGRFAAPAGCHTRNASTDPAVDVPQPVLSRPGRSDP